MNKSKFFPQILTGIAGGTLLCLVVIQFLIFGLGSNFIDNSYITAKLTGGSLLSILALIICIIGSFLAIKNINVLGSNPTITSLFLIITCFMAGTFGTQFIPGYTDTQGATAIIITVLSFPVSAISASGIILIQKKLNS